jgi:hypothetical protein
MRSPLRAALCAAAALFAVTGYSLDAQKGGKPRYVDIPGSAIFRCNTLDPSVLCPLDENAPKDRITGDGLGVYVGSGSDWQSGTGPFLRFDGEFSMTIVAGGGRRIMLDFRDWLLPPSPTFHRKDFDVLVREAFHINTNVIDPGTRDQAELGLRSIPIGATWKSRIKAGWNYADVLFNIRFNPDNFPGSDYVDVTRTGDKAWTIEALPWQRARLVSPGVGKGQPAPNDEGTYYMPFRIEFTVP